MRTDLTLEELQPWSDLRPCRIGEILGRAARFYRQRFGVLFGLSLLCTALTRCAELALGPDSRADAGSLAFWIALLLNTVGFYLFQVAVILIATLGVLRVQTGILHVIQQMRPALLLRMIGTIAVRWLLLLLLYAALVVPGLIYTVRWALSIHVVVLERQAYTDAMRRSKELMRHNFWRYVGLMSPVIVLVLVTGFAGVLELIDINDGIVILGSSAIESLLNPLISLAVTFLYLDIRVRNEGLDVEMTRKMVNLEGDIGDWRLRWDRTG